MTGWWQLESYLGELNRGEEDLALRIAQGDEAALEELFQQFGGSVKSAAFRVIRDETLAEDVVQETFVAIWRSPEKYDPSRGSFRTFPDHRP